MKEVKNMVLVEIQMFSDNTLGDSLYEEFFIPDPPEYPDDNDLDLPTLAVEIIDSRIRYGYWNKVKVVFYQPISAEYGFAEAGRAEWKPATGYMVVKR